MAHHHHKSSQVKTTYLAISILLNVLITIAQAIGGFVSGSLSLLSDALHNFSDVLSLLISFIANKLARKKASYNKTFGYKRAEIIAAFINAATLVVVAVILIIESIKRFIAPQEIESGLVIWLAALGIVANGISVLLLHKDANKNMNMKSAYLHLFTDMAASVAVLVGGLLMKFYQMWWVDSFLTLAIAIYLIFVGYDLLKKSVWVLMLFTPEDVRVEEITKTVNALPQIKSIHHIHIWQLNEDEVHLEAHLEFERDITLTEFDKTLTNLEELLYHQFSINHITIQPEYDRAEESKDVIVQD